MVKNEFSVKFHSNVTIATNVERAVKKDALLHLVKYISLNTDAVVSRALIAIRALVTRNSKWKKNEISKIFLIDNLAGNQNVLHELRVQGRLIELLTVKSLDVRDTAVSVLAQCVGHGKYFPANFFYFLSYIKIYRKNFMI